MIRPPSAHASFALLFNGEKGLLMVMVMVVVMMVMMLPRRMLARLGCVGPTGQCRQVGVLGVFAAGGQGGKLARIVRELPGEGLLAGAGHRVRGRSGMAGRAGVGRTVLVPTVRHRLQMVLLFRAEVGKV